MSTKTDELLCDFSEMRISQFGNTVTMTISMRDAYEAVVVFDDIASRLGRGEKLALQCKNHG